MNNHQNNSQNTHRLRHKQRATPQDTVCNHTDCQQTATHRAPISPQTLDSFYWFCLEHVRAYNKKWNYYQNMDSGMIAQDQYNDLLGNRPTWPFGGSDAQRQFSDSDIHRKFAENFDREEFAEQAKYDWHINEDADKAPNEHGDKNGDRQQYYQQKQAMPAKLQHSLAKMQLSLPINLQNLKKRYKTLVKQLHPDLHGHNDKNKQKMQEINLAYHDLKQWLLQSSNSL